MVLFLFICIWFVILVGRGRIGLVGVERIVEVWIGYVWLKFEINKWIKVEVCYGV